MIKKVLFSVIFSFVSSSMMLASELNDKASKPKTPTRQKDYRTEQVLYKVLERQRLQNYKDEKRQRKLFPLINRKVSQPVATDVSTKDFAVALFPDELLTFDDQQAPELEPVGNSDDCQDSQRPFTFCVMNPARSSKLLAID